MTFVDPTTALVLGLPAFARALTPHAPGAIDRWRSPHPVTTHAQWATLHEHILDTEAWHLAQTPQTHRTVARQFASLPTLASLLTTLAASLPPDDGQLFALKRFLFLAHTLCSLLWPQDTDTPHTLAWLMAAIHPEPHPTATFALSDALAPELAQANANLLAARDAHRAKTKALQHALLLDYPGATFSIHGDLRLDQPPDQQAATSDPRLAPCASLDLWQVIAPDLLATKAQIHQAQEQVEQAAGALRIRLGALLYERLSWLEALEDRLLHWDLWWARVRLKHKLGGCWVLWSQTLELKAMRPWHLQDAQPLDLTLRWEAPVVVTGPNMGGKSSLLKLLGQTCWALGHHLPVAAISAAAPGVGQICYLGAEAAFDQPESGHHGLSTFGQEITRLITLHQDAPPGQTLWLLDEFGRGTHPEEGAQILEHVLGALGRRGDLVVATTHFPQVSHHAGVEPWRIRGLVRSAKIPPEGVSAAQVHEVLRGMMDYQPERLGQGEAEVPRDAALVARLLGLARVTGE